jgi:chromosome partitioning protein
MRITNSMLWCIMARVIAIGGLKGGTGKSTLAVNLACQLAAGLRVHLIDVDRQESAQEWLAGSKLPVVGVALPLDDRRGAADWIRRVSAIDADLVMLDLPPQIGAATAAALILADLFLVPVAPSALDLRAAGKALELLQEAREARDDGKPAVLLVPSKVDRRTGAGREIEAALHEMGQSVGPAVGLRTAFVDSAAASDWIGNFAPRSVAHQEIAALAAVIDRITRRKS